MFVEIYGEKYKVNEDEFHKVHCEKKLNILENLGIFERIISLLSEFYEKLEKSNLVFINPTHGGFIPLKIKNQYDCQVFFLEENDHYYNFKYNYNDEQNLEKIPLKYSIYNDQKNLCILENDYGNIYVTNNHINDMFFYQLSDTDYKIYISKNIKKVFDDNFKEYIQDGQFEYDNLINLCFMVKNSGDIFEKILKDNIDIFDTYTILDTGSTDNTIETIKNVFKNKKGNIYCEDFINFRDSRNKLIDLAGKKYKFIIMLDDTYLITKNIRQYLRKVRGNQNAQSFSLYIKNDVCEYSSNRIIDTQYDLKYVYKIHEVIEKNRAFMVDNDIHIFDYHNDYLYQRTIDRKKFDLKLLFEELEENPDDPRIQYHIAQTYYCLENYEQCYEWYNKRINNNNGFFLEKVDSLLKCGILCLETLKFPIQESLKYFIKSYDLYKERADGLFYIGEYYYNNYDFDNAYIFLKKAFSIKYPKKSQFNIIYSITYIYVPLYLSSVCFFVKDYHLGKKAAKFFLEYEENKKSEYYQTVQSIYNIYEN